MDTGRIKEEYITQNGKHCGYINIVNTGRHYIITLYVFGIRIPAIIETRQTLEEAQTVFDELLSTYSY